MICLSMDNANTQSLISSRIGSGTKCRLGIKNWYDEKETDRVSRLDRVYEGLERVPCCDFW